jgi:hypothetical protein
LYFYIAEGEVSLQHPCSAFASAIAAAQPATYSRHPIADSSTHEKTNGFAESNK